MDKRLSFQLLLLIAIPALLFSCKKEIGSKQVETAELSSINKSSSQDLKFNTFKGPEIHIGEGKMRSFIIISHTDVPQEIGIEMTAQSFQGLPTEPGEYSFIVPLHQKANGVTPFDHMEIGWNPFGHPPVGVYTVPHFDFHFYKISLTEQLAIPPYTPQTAALFDNFPPPGYIPAGYIPVPGGVPQMGKHWADVTSPEFNGQPFSKTFVYGTYDGRVTFYEPMVTKAYIESGATSNTPIRQPQYFSPGNTYYPTQYNVYTDGSTGKHYISMSKFVLR